MRRNRAGFTALVLVSLSFVVAAPAVQARAPIEGTSGNDVLVGTDRRDTIDAKAGADQVFARAGSDIVKAGKGRDTVSGGLGQDTLFGDPGNDLLKGRDGRDSLVGGLGNDRAVGGPGGDQFGSLAPNFGFGGDDVLIGGRGIDVFLEDGNGDDILSGGPNRRNPDAFFPREFLQPGGGTDLVFGRGGPDEIMLEVDGRADIIRCGSGRDVVKYLGRIDHRDTLRGCERISVI